MSFPDDPQQRYAVKPNRIKEFLVWVATVGGIVLAVIGFVLFFTDRGGPVIFRAIGIGLAVLFGILIWFGLGLRGILRAVGTALIAVGIICMMRKPLAGSVCLLVGIACRLAAVWMTRHIRQSDSRNV